MNANASRTAERQIIKRFVADAIAAGYALSVRDDDGPLACRSTDAAEIVAAIYDGDVPAVFLRGDDGEMRWVTFVLGNGTDVISDYSDNARTVLAGARELAASLAR